MARRPPVRIGHLPRLCTDGLSDVGTIEIEDERHRQVMSLPLRAAAY
jgi:hypothetical protein